MDFLDPKKRQAEKIRLRIGYVLVAIAIGLGAYVVVLIAAGGFALRNGKVVQNGIVFVASQPSGSNVFISGNRQSTGTTGTRLTLPAGTYTLQIKRSGYRDWRRSISVVGDSVERFEYPFLFPTSLTTNTVQTFATKPALASQSPNLRWLLIQPAGELTSLQRYDLNNTVLANPATLKFPTGVLTATTTKSPNHLAVVAWADDNRHVLLKHTYDKKSEYILLDIQNPSQSLNLNTRLKLAAGSQLTLQNQKYNQYFVYNPETRALGTTNLSNANVTPLLQHVVGYAGAGGNTLVYATNQNADTPAGQTAIMLYQNATSYFVRNVAASSDYLLALTQYDGSWYIAVGSQSEGRVYVYQNPLDVLAAHDGGVLVPVAVLKVANPNYVSFSPSGQYVMTENANTFATYDVQYQNAYNYTAAAPFDASQSSANWLAAAQIDYVSHGQVVAFDYDGTNQQTLMADNPAYVPFFDPNYKYVYALTPQSITSKSAATSMLTQTALRTPADL